MGDKQRSKKSVSNESDEDHIRCCMCMKWEVCEQSEDYSGAIWMCETCRNLPSLIGEIDKKLNLVIKAYDDLNVRLASKETECATLQTKITILESINQTKEREISDLKAKIEENTKELQNKPRAPSYAEATRPKSLLTGSSLVRSVKTKELENTEVKTCSGARVSKIKEKLSETGEMYNTIALIAGSKDCASESATPESVINDYRDLINEAKSKITDEGTIKVCSIPPRTDNPTALTLSEDVNIHLEGLCEEMKCTFVDLTPKFKCMDQTVNSSMLHHDGLHLSWAGTQTLIKCLQLPGKPMQQSKVQQKSPRQGAGARYATQANRSSQPRCWKCGETGHVTDSCRHNQRLRCTSCNRLGHKSKLCGRINRV